MKITLLSLMMLAATLFAIPQTVVFDFGGVMTKKSARNTVASFLRESFYLSEEDYTRVDLERRRTMRSDKTHEEFWLDYAAEKAIHLPDRWSQTFESIMKDAIGANPEMYILVADLKNKQVPIAMLSNVNDDTAKAIREFGFYEPFYPCLLSCEIGVKKPDPQAYQILLERLHLPAEDIVFIDDKLENIKTAKELGIDGILFESPDLLRQELEKRNLL